MERPKKFSRFRGDMLNMKRLNGMPLSRKATYIANAFVGEMLRRRTIGTLGLRLAEIGLTDRCQCRCRHCFAAKTDSPGTQSEMSSDEIKMALDDLAVSGVTEVCFSGGEPLLREDILDLVRYAHHKQFVVRMITNGVALDRGVVAGLKKAGLNWCSLSIDSPVAEKHDEFRGYPGCFGKVVEGLELLIKKGVPCNIITVARKETLYSGELEDIVKLGLRLGVTAVRINFPVPIGRFTNKPDQVLTEKEREEVRKLLRYGIVTMESPREGTRCTAAVTKLNILPNGDVTPCVFVPLPYGNIRKQRFLDIWKSLETYTREFMISGQCPMCDASLREKLFGQASARERVAV